MASAPVIRASCSWIFFFSSTGIVSVAMSISLSSCLPAGPLAFFSDFQGFGDLFLILTTITESIRPLLHRFGLLDGGFQPFQIGVFVFPVLRPLAVDTVEFGFVHHGDAILHRANIFANAATAARLEIGVVGAVRGDVERRIRAVEPAQRALGAS